MYCNVQFCKKRAKRLDVHIYTHLSTRFGVWNVAIWTSRVTPKKSNQKRFLSCFKEQTKNGNQNDIIMSEMGTE